MTAPGSYTDSSLLLCTLLVVLLPLLSFIFSLLISERYSWLVSLNATVLLLITSILSIYLLSAGWNTGPVVFAMEWFTIGTTPLAASIVLTNTSLVMLGVVSLISFLVHVYSIGYMAGDPGVKKYFSMLGFFTSEVGATQVLQYNPVPGAYKGCIPVSEAGNGKTWAT